MEVDYPEDFRCPISKEVMKDPVTVSTGLTYERKNIEKWFFNYKKSTCPATMQCLHSFDLTPNHTLKRLIQNWQINNNKTNPDSQSCSSSPQPSINHDEMVSLLRAIESSPFKVTPLKKLRSVLGDWSSTLTIMDFIGSGGIEVLVKIVIQVLVDFDGFRACEEALGILHRLPLQSEEDKMFDQLSKPECIKAVTLMLQRGSADARLYAIAIFQKLAKANLISNWLLKDQGIDFFKSLLELVSDEICSKASSCALEVLIEILGSSKKSRLKAIEAGAICLLLELLLDSNRFKCEKILLLIKLLCEIAEGRLALVEHGLGIAAVTKKLLHVSNAATKLAVKILWLICNFNPTEKVVEEMMICGSVKNLLALMHIDGRSSTKGRVMKMFKLHGNSWKRYPCFPVELNEYLGLEK
ncbi:hypothetical protein HS088_TW17G00345 [Tripterygium wilfordii]|uniref:U-box domain-containing protein n=1 Tax=Tripterygium wilfordii TaxID=458696 RepID=A0A7J7CFF8_TRIWF|nr:E3 ubiquitin-protein ligase PUB23-like [Tripterygium wilfordii]KAF5732812.1 hypothetical protein HS088_TW17G00345 [Tripterygium wilfordii]